MKEVLGNRSSNLEKDQHIYKGKRILLGQLTSNGDCLYATAIARQIKQDYPDCHLTWAISSMCRSILIGNPHVDEVWEISIGNSQEVVQAWQQFEQEAIRRKKLGDFDDIFLTQLAPGNLENYDGTIRSSIFRAYPKPITVPITPVVRLTGMELANVCRFAEAHRLTERTNVILFECAPKSGQSFVTQNFAIEVSRQLINTIPDACIILSSNLPIDSGDERIIDGSVLSFRENAELTKYCSLLVGCSSGISWLSTSDWARPLPMIQLIKAEAIWFASFIHDYKQWGLDTSSIIEMTDCSPEKLVHCILAIQNEGFEKAKSVFHEQIPLKFKTYGRIQYQLLREGKYRKALRMLLNNIQKHGIRASFFLSPAQSLLEAVLKFFENKTSQSQSTSPKLTNN